MSNYSKVQFISWELYTGPYHLNTAPATGWYAGLFGPGTDKRTDALGQCADIVARIAFTADAIAKAEAASDRSATTLKVFMAPEFLYRGAGGAYLHDLIDGWTAQAPAEFGLPAPYASKWPGLFGGLRGLVAQPAYEHWLFVFGTALSASFPAARASSGRYLLDPKGMGEVYNSALIQRGGVANAASNYVSRKHYISDIDFINWTGAVSQHRPDSVLPLDPRTLLPADVMGVNEGGALFRIPGTSDAAGKLIDFGIEICLDHARSAADTADFGRIRGAGQYVKIQLVPSGGMSLVPQSIRLLPAGAATPHSYAFNCDGLGTLARTYGSHTQVWNGVNGASPLPGGNRLVEASAGAPQAGTVVVPVMASAATSHGPVPANALWDNGHGVQGSGHVRLLSALDL